MITEKEIKDYVRVCRCGAEMLLVEDEEPEYVNELHLVCDNCEYVEQIR